MNQVTAKLNYLHIAPRKVRLVTDALKGLSVNEAEAQLLFRPKRSSESLLKLLRSAVANAKNNHKLSADHLIIKDIRVNQGPMLKRFLPRAMGRATPIQKKTSHIFLVLEERLKSKSPRFNIAVSKKAKVPKAEKTPSKPKMAKTDMSVKKTKEKAGFLRKLFSRKSAV